jgi:hypothetical protein
MCRDPQITAEKKGIDSSIFAVSNHGVNGLLGVFLMYINHLFEYITIIYRARGNLRGGNHFREEEGRP